MAFLLCTYFPNMYFVNFRAVYSIRIQYWYFRSDYPTSMFCILEKILKKGEENIPTCTDKYILYKIFVTANFCCKRFGPKFYVTEMLESGQILIYLSVSKLTPDLCKANQTKILF